MLRVKDNIAFGTDIVRADGINNDRVKGIYADKREQGKQHIDQNRR